MILSFLADRLLAQGNCALKLSNAERLYEAGVIEQVPGLLESCLRSGFSEEQRIKAYKLLVMCRVFEDDMAGAEEYMMEFLRKFPFYEIQSSDDFEFVQLYRSYRTEPIFQIGLTGGINYSNVRVQEEFGLYNLNKYDGKYTSDGLGMQFGLSYNQNLNKNFSWSIGAYIQVNKFVYDLQYNEFTDIQLRERQNVYTFPLNLTYYREYGEYRPFIKLGIYGGLLSSSEASEITRRYNVEGLKDLTGSLDLKEHRKKFDFGIETGIGVLYKIKRGYLMFELSYHWGINGEVDESMRYKNEDLIYKYNYVDSKFYLNNIFVNVGIIYPFYKPVKKK